MKPQIKTLRRMAFRELLEKMVERQAEKQAREKSAQRRHRTLAKSARKA